MFSCEIDTSELERDWARACDELAGGINRGVERGVTEAAEQARSSHPYQDRTGRLTKSIHGKVTKSAVGAGGRAEGVIGARNGYASFVEGGTGPHEIRPKNAKALHFEAAGGEVFAGVVHHPGTPALPFMGPAVQRVERIIEVEVELAVARITDLMRS